MIEVIFIENLRDEKKFEKPALMVEQIKKDIVKAREIFET